MKKDNVLGLTAMGCGLLLALSVFLPFVSYYSTSLSLWKMEDPTRIIYLVLGIFVITLYLINKKTEMSYLASGYGIFTCVANMISNEGLEGLSVAFYLILMTSLAIGVITFLYNEKESDALINLSAANDSNENKANTQNISNEVVNEPITTELEKTRTVKYDPMTGQPIYLNENDN